MGAAAGNVNFQGQAVLGLKSHQSNHL
ncbi:hypothetical protein DFAR_2230013 [Desulfarculales bacterium]